MSSTWGDSLKLSIFGESHSGGIGVVLDGFPAGIAIDFEQVARFMARRAPSGQAHATKRRESDTPEVLSGILNGVTCGTPIACVIRNSDTRSQDYANLADTPRPGHADYTGAVRYGGYNDPRGGGHFSGRLTAPLVFAGALCAQVLAQEGITVGAHISAIHGVCDAPFDEMGITAAALLAVTAKGLPVLDDAAGHRMLADIESARAAGDSVGGVVECAAVGLPAGLGDPMFGGVENEIASLVLGIPAVRGIEFGAGFAAAGMMGSAHNDAFTVQDGKVKTKTNRHGGVLGGITSGMPLLFRAAFKPTPSIAEAQQSVSLSSMTDCEMAVQGRHDPCVVVRAVPCVEAAAMVAL
ncbi:MAG: chorismate synthase, partial [Acetanaerobacterium sp.]